MSFMLYRSLGICIGFFTTFLSSYYSYFSYSLKTFIFNKFSLCNPHRWSSFFQSFFLQHLFTFFINFLLSRWNLVSSPGYNYCCGGSLYLERISWNYWMNISFVYSILVGESSLRPLISYFSCADYPLWSSVFWERMIIDSLRFCKMIWNSLLYSIVFYRSKNSLFIIP